MNDTKWNWDDFFLFLWLAKLWDWTFGTSGKSRRSAKKARKASRRASRRYKGSRTGLSRADNLICDLMCFIYLAPLAALFVASRQKSYQKRTERRTQREKRNSPASVPKRAQKGSSTASRQSRSMSTSANSYVREAYQHTYTKLTEAQLHGLTEEQLAEKKRLIGRSATLSEEQKASEAAWAAEQRRKDEERRNQVAIEKQRTEAKQEATRLRILNELPMPLTAQYTSDSFMLEMSARIATAGKDKGSFLGLFDVSYLTNEANSITIGVAVKDDVIVKVLEIGNLPENIRQPVTDYIEAGGDVRGYTKNSWINAESHTMKVAIFMD